MVNSLGLERVFIWALEKAEASMNSIASNPPSECSSWLPWDILYRQAIIDRPGKAGLSLSMLLPHTDVHKRSFVPAAGRCRDSTLPAEIGQPAS